MIEIPKFNFDRSQWVENYSLNGRKLSQLICDQITAKLVKFNKKPGLAVLIVGDDPASTIYIESKRKKAKSLGFYSEIKRLQQETSKEEIIQIIKDWNQNDLIHGILVQLPLPKSIDAQEVLSAISIHKDADGFHFENMGRLLSNHNGNIPCTPLGIIIILNELNEPLEGKHAVILGRSNIVGKPMAQLLLDYSHCTITICHSKTKNISNYVRDADILVSAIGKRDIVQMQDIKKGAIIIDVGIHRTKQGITGDLDHKHFIKNKNFATPVPGGVGPMTIAMLMYNTYKNFININ